MRVQIKTILKTVMSIGLFVFLYNNAEIRFPVSHVKISYAFPFLEIVSAILGPLAGALVGSVGTVFSNESTSLNHLLSIGLNGLDGLIVGLLCRKIDVENNFFGKNELFTFVKAAVFGNFFCFVVVRPIVLFVYSHIADVNVVADAGTFSTGVWLFLVDSILSLDVAALLLFVYARTRLNAANFYRS